MPGCEPPNPPVALVGGGGGSGGSVWIEAGKIVGQGVLSASGGSTNNLSVGSKTNVMSPGGAGGGGRLAVYYGDLSPDVELRAWGGRSMPKTAYGTAGTIFLKNTRTFYEELRFENGYTSAQDVWPSSNVPVEPKGSHLCNSFVAFVTRPLIFCE